MKLAVQAPGNSSEYQRLICGKKIANRWESCAARSLPSHLSWIFSGRRRAKALTTGTWI